VDPEEKTLARSPAFLYAILTDSNGYVPAHNKPFAQPLTGNAAQDYLNNRTKRLLGDTASVLAARSELPYLRQHTKLETGDTIYDLSVPVIVNRKHWGCVRIGYRRGE
jgi:methyl-accepting chemotaxis protein